MDTFIATENPECCRKCGTQTEPVVWDQHGYSVEECPNCGYVYKLEPEEEDGQHT